MTPSLIQDINDLANRFETFKLVIRQASISEFQRTIENTHVSYQALLPKIDQILETHGWPAPSEVGVENSNRFLKVVIETFNMRIYLKALDKLEKSPDPSQMQEIKNRLPPLMNRSLCLEILDMADEAETLMNGASDSKSIEELKANFSKQEEARKKQIPRLQQIMDQYGWPGFDNVGFEVSNRFLKVVQFTLDTKIYQKALDLLKIKVADKQGPLANIARLEFELSPSFEALSDYEEGEER